MSAQHPETRGRDNMVETGFKPSKNRKLGEMLTAGEAKNQPKALALPTIVVGEHGPISEHARAASCVNPKADLINRAARPLAQRVAHFCVCAPGRIIERRRDATGYIKSIDCKSEPDRLKRAAPLPPKIPTRNLRPPADFIHREIAQFPGQ